jgi:hypothetical protein
MSAVLALFLVLDGVTKVMKAPAVPEAFVRLGIPVNLAPGDRDRLARFHFSST